MSVAVFFNDVNDVRAAGTYYVDGTHPSCSDAGSGSAGQPYCSITAAIDAQAGPGTTILVQPGTYREQVTLPTSGAAGAPIVIRADGPVTIDGSDDYSSTGLWAAYAGNVYLASSVDWNALQVFVDGERLAPSTASPAAIPANSFRYVSGTGLYVNVGGGNPGTHSTHVSRRTFGFRGSERAHVTIDGFTVLRTEDRGIYFSTNSDFVQILDNIVRQAYRPGIQVTTSSNALIQGNVSLDNLDHGIAVTETPNSVIADNEAYRNRKPVSTSVASGIYLSGSPNSSILRNRIHDNTGSGLYMQTGSNDARCVQNASWSNGRRGFDLWNSTGTHHVGDVAWGNAQSGFAYRGSSSGARLDNCIGASNGLASGEWNLEVNSTATSGFGANDNIWWNGTTRDPIQWSGNGYATVAAFAATTGNDTRSLQADPRFVAPAAGDFRLQSGSPAIDSGNSSVADWPPLDAAGLPRYDDPATPNSGLGPITYADRGAHELQGSASLPPIAALSVSPSSGAAPLSVTADASGSVAGDGAIVSYRFDFGDGTIVGPQAQPVAFHSYAAGSWLVTVTVTDAEGDTDTASQGVSVFGGGNPPNGIIENPVKNLVVAAGQGVFFTASGSDPDGDLPLAYAWNMGGGAPDSDVEAPGIVTFDSPGTYTVTLTVTDAAANADPTPDTRVITVTQTFGQLAADEIHWTITGETSVSFDWRGSPSSIQYGLTSAYGQTANAYTPSPLPWSSSGPFREARLTGLQPNTVYHYSIGGSPDQTFRTAPVRGASDFTVAALADIGSTLSYFRVGVVASQIAAIAPDLVLAPGDLTYGNDHGPDAVDQAFNDHMLWSRESAYMPQWGNHDWEPNDDLRNYKGRFDLPNAQTSPGSPIAGGEDWYWFDYGNVRFIGYPEPWTGAWADWLSQAQPLFGEAQADPDIDFIVTWGHRPAYSSGHHAGSATLRSYLDGLGATYPKYVLNFNGHSHNYERTYPQSGVTHVTVGIGGSTLEIDESGGCLYGGGCPPPATTAFRAMHHGFLKLTFTATGILGEAICGPAGDSGSNKNDITCEPGSVFDSFTIGNPDRAPLVSAPSHVSAEENGLVSIAVTANDPDGETITSLSADLSGLPQGHDAIFASAFDNLSGTLSWTPTYADAGSYDVAFIASNGLSGQAPTTITVANRDRPPELGAPASANVLEADTLRISVSATDPDGNPITSLTADLSGLPAGHGASFAPGAGNTSGILTWVPSYVHAGVYAVRFIAANALSDTASVALTVTNRDRAPGVVGPALVSVNEQSPLALVVSASDPDGDPISSLTANLASLPTGHNAVFTTAANHASGTLSWTPTYAHAGSYAVTFTASNALSGQHATTISVQNVDRAPLITRPASMAGAEGSPVSVVVAASDPDGQAITSLTADLSRLPVGHGATFTPGAGNTSGTLSWTPTYVDSGSHKVFFTAANTKTTRDSTTLVIANTDRPPIVSAPAATSVTEGSPLTVIAYASDPDGNPITSLTADLGALPVGHDAVFVPGPGNLSGVLTWTPALDDGGTNYAIAFTATNALTGGTTTVVTVTNQDRAPIVTAPAATSASEGQLVQLVVTASDPDGDPITSLTADLSGLPSGHDARFAAGPGNLNGTFTWTPTPDDSGQFIVAFTAANTLQHSVQTVITVSNADRAPTLIVPPLVAAAENQGLSIVVVASDPDGDPITSLSAEYSKLPAGNASFTPNPTSTSGTLTWTPAPGDGVVGVYFVSFTAQNARSSTAGTAITVDRAPVVTSPLDVPALAGNLISVSVTAADPNGDPIANLTADVSELPAGHDAVFIPAGNKTSGVLYWTPTLADTGRTFDVTFRAINGTWGETKTSITVMLKNDPPRAVVQTSPSAGVAPLLVGVDASRSSDPENAIAAYLFDFGDGTSVGPQASPTTSHVYAAGEWTMQVRVRDVIGVEDTVTVPINVVANMCGNPSFETSIAGWNAYRSSVLQRVPGGFVGSQMLQVTGPGNLNEFGVNDSPDWISGASVAGTRYRYTARVRSLNHHGTARLRVREYNGGVQQGATTHSPGVQLGPEWQLAVVEYVAVLDGSSLNLQVLDAPQGPGEVFLVDYVTITTIIDGVTAAGEPDIRDGLEARVYPNPVRSHARLRFALARPSPVTIELYDLHGRVVRSVVDDLFGAGVHKVPLTGNGVPRLPAGVYFYRLETEAGRMLGRFVQLE